jgi:hypothetical protein
MTRLSILTVLALSLVAAQAQGPNDPTITATASGSGDGQGSGSITVSGNITTPAPWQLSIHTVTVKFTSQTGGKSLNAFVPVKGPNFSNFSASVGLKRGAYSIVAIIDVKDADGHERQISSQPQQVNVP